jgi:L-ascorbate metabolism protein UlaG (beta-lactamase superfamily)
MTTTEEVAISFHGSTFLELTAGKTSIFLDPVFSSSRRGRRLRGATRASDYVFVTGPGDFFEDALDALEDSTATLVSSERVCRTARTELDLDRDRTLDLEAWERASEAAFRVTAVPVSSPSMMDDGMSMIGDLGGGAVGRMVPQGATRLPLAGLTSGLRVLESLPIFGQEIARNLRGRPALGFLFEFTSGQRVLHLVDGVHAGADEQEIEDIAALSPVDALLIDIGSQSIESVVRAVRAFEVGTVLLYRSQDPYARGRRSQAQPIGAFLEALQEDRGSKIEVLHLREGDRFILEAPEKKPAATTTTATPAKVTTAAPASTAAPRPATSATPSPTTAAKS